MTKRIESTRRFGMILLIMVMVAGNLLACALPWQGGGSTTPQPIPIDDEEIIVSDNGGPVVNGNGDKPGLSIRLSDGQEIPSVIESLVPIVGIPLTQDEIDEILARLSPWVEDQGLDVDFRLPEEVFPPPLTGDTIPETFPTNTELTGPLPVYGDELEVLRFAPDGEVLIAPFISVTFNQPMIALNTLEALAEEDVPVQITPVIPGTWRWLGTKTLTFNSDSELFDRLPMATEYLVTIPAGIESALGKTLQETVQFRFSTPPIMIEDYYPSSSPQPLEPLFFISFDQRIDQSAVLKNLQVTAGNLPVQVKLATEDEIKEDETISRRIEYAGEGRWLVFRALEPLPPDTSISVNVRQGSPSAEGSLVTKQDQTFGFQTYSPLQIIEHGCSWGGDECRPLTPLYIRFNNPIDLDSYDETMISIEPELPNASVNIFGNTINIRGNTQGRTTYWVTVDGSVQDIFGQTLGKNERLKFKIGSAEPVLFGPEEIFVTVDPADANPALSLFTMNYTKLNVEIYSVVPSDWPDFIQYLRDYQRTDLFLSPPGKKVWDGSLPIESAADKLTEVYIPIADHMTGKSGQFIVVAKPPKGLFQEDRYWETVQVWVQVTQIGLDAFVDHTEMVTWATDLLTGVPIPGVEIRTNTGKLMTDTDLRGVGRFDLPPEGITYLIAEKGDDLAFMPPSNYYWSDSSWSRRSTSDELRWYVWDDRQMYKPGEVG